MGQGDCLLFAGRDFLHWREATLNSSAESLNVNVNETEFVLLLLHYVQEDWCAAV